MTMVVGNLDDAVSLQGIAAFTFEEVMRGKKLGSGGFCHVYEARFFHPKTPAPDLKLTEHQAEARVALAQHAKTLKKIKDTRFAIKMLQPSLTRNPKKYRIAAKDMAMEAHVLSKLSHPNIIKLRGMAMESSGEILAHERRFLIMDRLSEDLNGRLQKWTAREARLKKPIYTRFLDREGIRRRNFFIERLYIVTEIASALEYIHENRIVFRDVKPGNIGFSDSNDLVTLFDFGLARRLPEGSSEFNDTYQMSGRAGTVRYMSPEMAMGKPYNEKADVFSFAHVMFYVLALDKPYRDYCRQEHRVKVIHSGERPPLYREWPRDIQTLLTKSWSTEILERPSMTEILTIINQVINDLTQEKPVEQMGDSMTVYSTGSQSLAADPAKSFDTETPQHGHRPPFGLAASRRKRRHHKVPIHTLFQ